MSSGYVCLTFDFDALSSWLARGITSATPRSRGEFAAVATRRLLSILRRRGLVSTWFVPAHTAVTYPELCRKIVEDGHEIALHGYAHENVAVLERDVERDLLVRSIDRLTEVTGTRPVGFRAPSWDLSEHSVDLMVEQDLLYDSSMMADDHSPYLCRTHDRVDVDGTTWGQETSLVQIPVSWTLDDFPHLEFLRSGGAVMPGLQDPRSMFDRWYDDLRWMLRELTAGVLTVTCHPEVIGRGHRLIALEDWLDRICQHDVDIVTCAAVATRFRQGEALGTPKQGPGAV